MAKNIFKSRNKEMLIHIGKCGGSSVKAELLNCEWYSAAYAIAENVLHATRPWKFQDEKYIVTIRNPIHRFISAFYHMYFTFLRCEPKNKHAASVVKNLRNRFNHYKTANNLAESLYDNNGNLNFSADTLIKYHDLPSADRICSCLDGKATYSLLYRNIDKNTESTSNLLVNYKKLVPSKYPHKNFEEKKKEKNTTLIKTFTILDLINEEKIDNPHMDNHLGMDINWYLEDLIKDHPESIVGVITTENMKQDMLRIFGVESEKHLNKHTREDNWGSKYDARLTDLARANLRKYLEKDYECILKLKNLNLITDEYYDYCKKEP